jgi:hypothetical protein
MCYVASCFEVTALRSQKAVVLTGQSSSLQLCVCTLILSNIIYIWNYHLRHYTTLLKRTVITSCSEQLFSLSGWSDCVRPLTASSSTYEREKNGPVIVIQEGEVSLSPSRDSMVGGSL